METNDDSKYSWGKCLEVGLKFLAAHHIPPEVLLWPLAAAVLYFEKTSCVASSESDLKERKKRGEKKKSPRTPLIKEKQPQKIEKEILSLDTDAKEDFRKECLGFIGQYDEQQVADFYHYWSEASKRGTMRFQRQKYWDTEKRLKRWCKNRYSSENTAAALRLERLKKKEPERAPERERKQQRLEQEIAERKRNAVSYEEYLKMKSEK
jgi:hypothetical protein